MGLSWPGVGIPKQCLAHRDLDRRVVPGLLPARSPGQVSKPGETNPPRQLPGPYRGQSASVLRQSRPAERKAADLGQTWRFLFF